MTKGLNTRQLDLYKFFIEHDFSSLEGIFFRLDKYYDRASETCVIANSTAYRLLRKDIEDINLSNSQYAILPMKEKGRVVGYKLAEKNEEILSRADNYHQRAMRYLQKEKELRKKVRNDNQVRIANETELKIIKATKGE